MLGAPSVASYVLGSSATPATPTPTPAPAKKKKKKAKKANTITVSGKTVDFSVAKVAKKKVTVKKASIKSRKIKKLKAGKRYYVRMRAYKTINGKKYYSAWSKTWSVKTR